MEQVMKEIMDMVMGELWRQLSITGGGGHVGSYGDCYGGHGGDIGYRHYDVIVKEVIVDMVMNQHLHMDYLHLHMV